MEFWRLIFVAEAVASVVRRKLPFCALNAPAGRPVWQILVDRL
jgi:hypothetical protein